MELDPHAQSIDQDSDHNPSSKVLAVHNLSECVAHQPPEAHDVCCSFAKPAVLPFGLAVSPVPVVVVLDGLVHAITIRVSGGLVAVSTTL